MPKFIIRSSETVYYETELEADNEEQARAKFWEMNHGDDTLITYDADHWQIDDVIEESEDA